MNIIINKTHGSTECRWRGTEASGGGQWRLSVVVHTMCVPIIRTAAAALHNTYNALYS